MYLTVYLNDKKLTDCFEADEEQGYAWVEYRNVEGQRVPAIMAEPNALIYADMQVIKLFGKVRFTIDPPEGMTVEDIKRECEKHFVPIRPTKNLCLPFPA